MTDKSAPIRRKAKLSESAFGIATLLLTVLVVHGFYTLVVRPRAVASLAQAAAMQRGARAPDLFALLIIRRWRAVQRDRALLELPFMESNEGLMVLSQDVRIWKRQIERVAPEALSLDAENSMLRFVVWGIPAVGFVGTARGIGNALQDAQSALMGVISGVTVCLGITFNSTLTASTLCLLIMFLLHQLQHVQDRVVIDTKNFIEQRLVARLRLG